MSQPATPVIETAVTTAHPNYRYVGAALAADIHHGFRVQLFAIRGRTELLIMNGHVRPRQFKQARHAPPELRLLGDFHRDARVAASWLRSHLEIVVELELARVPEEVPA